MNWLKNLFSTHRGFIGEFVETGEGLTRLIQSNPIVSAEYVQFEKRAQGLENREEVEIEATKSADALSGYGISISPQAFLETLDK